MTVKRDFKRRVRQRQARTGESYVTARRHTLAGRPASDAGEASPADGAADPARDAAGAASDETPVDRASAAADRRASGISVVELIDVSEEAKRLGLMCGVRMFPALAARIPPARVLGRLRDILVATVDDPETAALATLALTGQKPRRRSPLVHAVDGFVRFLQRARAGLGGTYHEGAMLAFHVADGDGMVPTLCTLSAREAEIELSLIDGLLPPQLEPLIAAFAHARPGAPARDLEEVFMALQAPSTLAARRAVLVPRPALFVIHQQRRYPIAEDEFVIGRNPHGADLVIDDGMISQRHAVVVRRGSAYYIADLGTANGITYKGVRITDKRIDEGDVFGLGAYELRFTFRDE